MNVHEAATHSKIVLKAIFKSHTWTKGENKENYVVMYMLSPAG